MQQFYLKVSILHPNGSPTAARIRLNVHVSVVPEKACTRACSGQRGVRTAEKTVRYSGVLPWGTTRVTLRITLILELRLNCPGYAALEPKSSKTSSSDWWTLNEASTGPLMRSRRDPYEVGLRINIKIL